jgi:protein-tyrosine-phosphatase
MKTAELSNTHTMPAAVSDTSPEKTKAVVKKTAAGHLVGGKDGHRGKQGVETETNKPVLSEQPTRLVQARVMSPHVDVSCHEPPKLIQEKKAERTALRGRYPLDSYEHVKKASAYFDEWYKRFSPEDRHEFATNMVKRAQELGISVSEIAQKYGSETYASESDVKIALDIRKSLVEDETQRKVLDKLAHIRPMVEPELFCNTLSEFDKMAGLDFLYDRDVPDPYYSTYGFEKKAEFSETIGNLTVHGQDLEYLAIKRLPLVKGTFTEELAEAFRKDPVGIYKSLPLEQRKVFANMAREQRAGAPGSG